MPSLGFGWRLGDLNRLIFITDDPHRLRPLNKRISWNLSLLFTQPLTSHLRHLHLSIPLYPYTYISNLRFHFKLVHGLSESGSHNELTEVPKGEPFATNLFTPVPSFSVSANAKTDLDQSQVSANDEEDCQDTPQTHSDPETIPSSPPPSFRSRASSPSARHLLSQDPITTEAERTLADTFDDGSDSDDDGHNAGDDRQRLMRANSHHSESEQRNVNHGNAPNLPGAVTRLPVVAPPVSSNIPARTYTGATPYSTFSHSNDGVFANLDAKPERGEKIEEQPPVFHVIASFFVTLS